VKSQENVPLVATDNQTAPENALIQRYVPLASWLIVLLTLLFIGVKIIGYGYVPTGDARRHVAKAFVDKPYTQIVVMRPGYTVDHNPGWEWLLRQLHRMVGWNMDSLISFAIIGLLLCVFFAPLPWLRRPEAWLAALLAQTLVIPELMERLTLARPFLVTEGVLIAVLFSWAQDTSKKPSWLKLAVTCIGISLSVWIHGGWYLWVLPVTAFFLAQQWRAGFWLAACWVAGTIAGSLLTGRPVEFLKSGLEMITDIYREKTPQWLLVGELLPSGGEFGTLVLLAFVFLWRKMQNKSGPGLVHSPVFWLIVVGWILGLRADRSWADWGVPAVLVWLTLQFEEGMAGFASAVSPKRLVICGLLAVSFFFHSTNDLDRRYTRNLSDEVYLEAGNPALQGWLPEGNGIFYSADMVFFYNTFYKNPGADWRYIVGFEPALTPEDDLKILRRIQWNHGAFKAYQPWVDKMQPADRLAISCSVEPNLPGLQWTNAVGNLWIGRKPR
jgi:hypothetical protein